MSPPGRLSRSRSEHYEHLKQKGQLKWPFGCQRVTVCVAFRPISDAPTCNVESAVKRVGAAPASDRRGSFRPESGHSTTRRAFIQGHIKLGGVYIA
jgi:hypothetical protein